MRFSAVVFIKQTAEVGFLQRPGPSVGVISFYFARSYKLVYKTSAPFILEAGHKWGGVSPEHCLYVNQVQSNCPVGVSVQRRVEKMFKYGGYLQII